eukprot:EG_transcript_48982
MLGLEEAEALRRLMDSSGSSAFRQRYGAPYARPRRLSTLRARKAPSFQLRFIHRRPGPRGAPGRRCSVGKRGGLALCGKLRVPCVRVGQGQAPGHVCLRGQADQH